MNDCPLQNEASCFKTEFDCTCKTCPLNTVAEASIEEIRRVDMLTIKDKVEQFKRDCRSNEFYSKAILDCNEQIEELDVILTGLGSSASDDPKLENAGDPYRPIKWGPMMKQDEIIKKRDSYIRRINYVNAVLMKITNPLDRQMIIDLYIEHAPCKKIADKYHYNDHSAMYKRVNSVLKETFSKMDTM